MKRQWRRTHVLFYSSLVWTDGRILEDGYWSLVPYPPKNRIWWQLAPSSYFSGWGFSSSAFAFGLPTAFALFPTSSWCLGSWLYGYFWLDSGYHWWRNEKPSGDRFGMARRLYLCSHTICYRGAMPTQALCRDWVRFRRLYWHDSLL